MNPQFRSISFLIALVCCVSLPYSVNAQFIQQGSKLAGTGVSGFAGQGWSVALSGDGNTAIAGGPGDSNKIGAAWVYKRTGGVWAQQGIKLVGTDFVLGAYGSEQGNSVAISSDGTTAIIGGPTDNDYIGAAWVYTLSSGLWPQQGNKLGGGDAVNGRYGVEQGNSVCLSQDGNTAIIGGPADNGNVGAAWVFTRTGGVWTQQGKKLVGTGGLNWVMGPQQGYSVSLSADGNTAIIGGPLDSVIEGAVWIFTRTNGVWTQQGNKLVGSDAVGTPYQGTSVSISGDGNTAIVGGYSDSGGVGAAWVFTRSNGVWTQQGNKLVGSGAVGVAFQGHSVSLSSDGNRAIVGGDGDDSGKGAAWVYQRNGNVWTQLGSKLIGAGAVGPAREGEAVSISGDGKTAIVGSFGDHNNTGAIWVFIDTTSVTAVNENPIAPYNYQLFPNYPNPFNPATKITYSIPKETHVSVIVYDLLGREVTRLIQETKLRGEYSVTWNATNVPSGVYYCRLVAGSFVETKKMVVMK